MRIFATEFKKLFSNKIFILVILAVLTLNAYLLFRTANSGEVKPSDYAAVYDELEGKTDSEKLEWLEEQLNDFSGQRPYNWDVIAELYDECSDVVGYSDYLASIESQAKSMTSVSIFAKPDTFNYRNIIKTPPAYENVQDVTPVFDVSKGIILSTDNNFTDILCAFVLLFSVIYIMISDREQGMSGLLFALKRGRSYLLLTKSAVLFTVISAFTILIYIENLFVSSFIYGLGDLLRPIQSLNGFIGCNFNISVLTYLIIYVIFKSIVMFLIGMLLSLIAVSTKNTVTFYSIAGCILIVEGVLYKLIHPLSIYSIFRYINIIAFTKVNDIFCNYKNINFWEYPIPLVLTSIISIIIFISISVFLTAYLYAKRRNLEFRKLSVKKVFSHTSKMHRPIYYTFYKSLILQKGIFVIIVCFFAVIIMNNSFVKEYDVSDVYYKYYAELLEGNIDSETDEFIASEDARFTEISEKIDELVASESYTSELDELYKEYAPSLGFYLVKERYDIIKNNNQSQIFYDTGYKRMFGKTGYDDDMKYALISMLFCVFLVSPLISNDKKYRMNSIINSTKSGKNSYLKRNIFAATIYGLLSSILWITLYSIVIKQYYGFSCLSAPLNSIIDFADVGSNIKIWQYAAIIFILRTFSIIFASLLMLWVSSNCRNTTSALLINFALFTLPIIIYLFGADIMINFGLNAFLSADAIFNDLSFIQFLIPVLLVIIFLFSIYYKKRQQCYRA